MEEKFFYLKYLYIFFFFLVVGLFEYGLNLCYSIGLVI